MTDPFIAEHAHNKRRSFQITFIADYVHSTPRSGKTTFVTDLFMTDHIHNRPIRNRPRS